MIPNVLLLLGFLCNSQILLNVTRVYASNKLLHNLSILFPSSGPSSTSGKVIKVLAQYQQNKYYQI